MSFVKSVTTKPVVTVGRFTSPETMTSQVRQGIVDFIGAARPSIADPFLPNKILEGRAEDIRECIGCNICYTGDGLGTPIRCTQNPTMGEESRRNWHPEVVASQGSDAEVLIVGAGPAGMEAARCSGNAAGVMLAEATRERGRVVQKPRYPVWANGFGFVTTGSNRFRRWLRYRCFLRVNSLPMMSLQPALIMSSSQQARTGGRMDLAGRTLILWRPSIPHQTSLRRMTSWRGNLSGPVVIYDDDSFYMGGLVAEKISIAGQAVTW